MQLTLPNYSKYLDRQAEANKLDPAQTLPNVGSGQGLRYSATFTGTMDLFKIEDKVRFLKVSKYLGEIRYHKSIPCRHIGRLGVHTGLCECIVLQRAQLSQ